MEKTEAFTLTKLKTSIDNEPLRDLIDSEMSDYHHGYKTKKTSIDNEPVRDLISRVPYAICHLMITIFVIMT